MTSSTSPITAMRPSARALITLLAALSLVFSQLIGFAASAASAEEEGNEEVVEADDVVVEEEAEDDLDQHPAAEVEEGEHSEDNESTDDNDPSISLKTDADESGLSSDQDEGEAAVSAAIVTSSLVTPDAQQPQDSQAGGFRGGTNGTPYWEDFGLQNFGEAWSCTKFDVSDANDNFTLNQQPAAGTSWRLLIVKQATTDYLFDNPTVGSSFDTGGAYSHYILCSIATTPPPADGTVIVKKIVNGDAVPAVLDDFGFTLVCNGTTKGAFEIGHNEQDSVSKAGGYTACTVEEDDAQDATGTTWAITGATTNSGTGLKTDSFNVGEDKTVTIIFTNTYDAPDDPPVYIDVEKVFYDGISQADEPSFRVDLLTGCSSTDVVLAEDNAGLDCEYTFVKNEGEGREYGPAVPVGEDGSYSVEETDSPTGYSPRSNTVGDFNISALLTTDACGLYKDDVQDVASALAGQIPSDAILCTHTVINDAPPTNGGPTPTPRTGEVTVEKIVAGDVADVPASAEFAFTLECGNRTETFTLVDGESETFTGITATSNCTVSETDDQAADTTTWAISGDVEAVVTPGTATDEFNVGANDEITVTFTNEYSAVAGEIEVASDITVVKTAINGFTADSEGNKIVTLKEDERRFVTYQYTVTNTGEDDLVNLTLLDDKLGDLTDLLVAELGEDATLPIGSSVSIEIAKELGVGDFDAGNVHTNVVIVTGLGTESERTVTDDDDETVVLLEVRGEIETEDPTVTPVVDTTETVAAQQHPRTGFDTGALAGLGLLLTALGAGALLLGRRRDERGALS